jgi:methionyl-tRNA synthetase
VSGLVKHVPEAEMQGRRAVVLCNLKPAAMRGVTSQAMVLCASDADGKVRRALACAAARAAAASQWPVLTALVCPPTSTFPHPTQSHLPSHPPPTHPKVELLDPPAGAKVGERLTAAGYPGEPDEVLNPKKKIFEAVAPDLATNSDRVACYKGVPLMTSAGPATAASVAGGGIGLGGGAAAPPCPRLRSALPLSPSPPVPVPPLFPSLQTHPRVCMPS